MECDNQGAHVTELPVFDPQEALRVTGNRAAIATHLLGLFLNELPEARLVITDLAADGEREALRARVHKLAGSAMYCGAVRLLAVSRALEAAIEDGAADVDIETGTRSVLDEIGRFIAAAPKMPG